MMHLELGDTRVIIQECAKQNLPVSQAAYVLATAYWETARTMKPVREAFWLSEAWRKTNLRYFPWYGRGYVQLTWEANYKKASEELGVDLTTDPDSAMIPEIASKVLVRGMKQGWFTGHTLDRHINPRNEDFYQARRIVNGMDKNKEIAKIAYEYGANLRKWNYPEAFLPTQAERPQFNFWTWLASIFNQSKG